MINIKTHERLIYRKKNSFVKEIFPFYGIHKYMYLIYKS